MSLKSFRLLFSENSVNVCMFINLHSGFAAFMKNHMTWSVDGAESFLEVDIKLSLTLEVVLILMKDTLMKYAVFYPNLTFFFFVGELK